MALLYGFQYSYTQPGVYPKEINQKKKVKKWEVKGEEKSVEIGRARSKKKVGGRIEAPKVRAKCEQ